MRRRLEQLLDEAEALLPPQAPDGGWDELQSMVRDLRFQRRVLGWADDSRFFEALGQVASGKLGVTQKRWGEAPEAKAAAKALGLAFEEFAAADGLARRTLEQWRAHRYPVAIEMALGAAASFREFRRRHATLSYQDLLLLAAELLRTSPEARQELAARFRYVLVDEFQDTDPIQAEVVLLLTARDAGETDWRRAVPRPGSLFVVGDPKQSIYRFRRADIAIYNQVRARFLEFGEVVELTANFRSVPAIGEWVNRVFDAPELFPRQATPEQAAFAPVEAVRRDGRRRGVFHYAPEGRVVGKVTDDDAERLASWIRGRMDAGERRAGDFMVLTRAKKHLTRLARALEARNVPVQVTGAVADLEEELSELILLLRALADPEDASLTLAALLGLYFGIDFDALTEHVAAGGRISYLGAPPEPRTAVEAALAKLNGWWRLARAEPADTVVARLVDELGILPYAAAGELGEMRAGALAFALDAVRTAGLRGETSLAAAVAALSTALDAEEVTAPLEPGRTDSVQLMNLHKAKGLEAEVVVLACPVGDHDFAPERHIHRSGSGPAMGYMEVVEKQGHGRGGPCPAARVGAPRGGRADVRNRGTDAAALRGRHPRPGRAGGLAMRDRLQEPVAVARVPPGAG